MKNLKCLLGMHTCDKLVSFKDGDYFEKWKRCGKVFHVFDGERLDVTYEYNLLFGGDNERI